MKPLDSFETFLLVVGAAAVLVFAALIGAFFGILVGMAA